MKKSFAFILLSLAVYAISCSPSGPPPVPIPTPSSTSIPTASPQPTVTPTVPPTPIYPHGAVMTHLADSNIKYHWVSYIPESLKRDEPVYILVTGIRAEFGDYDELRIMMHEEVNWRKDLAEKYRLVLLAPHIPRSNRIYAAAFDRQVFTISEDNFFYRPDLEILKMIDELSSNLAEDGYEINQEVFLEGFSVGGMFAQRFALLHPDKVKAVAVGQCGGWITFPLVEYKEIIMNWPVGINDYKELTGYDFDFQCYKDIPHFFYIGSIDDTNSMVPFANNNFNGRGNFSFMENDFGKTDPTRLPNQVNYLQEYGLENVVLKIYPGIGHSYTDQMIADGYDFLVKDLGRAYPTPYPLPESLLPIIIDGNADDWEGKTPAFSDRTGDSLLSDDFEIRDIYVQSDSNYFYVMVDGVSNLDQEVAKRIRFELDTISDWQSDFILRIGSDTSISFTKYEPLPDEIDHFGIEAYWGDVLELRILRNIFPDLKHFDIRYINLLAYIDGDFSMVDSTLNNP